jgi:hypothetical protein
MMTMILLLIAINPVTLILLLTAFWMIRGRNHAI